MEENKQTHSHEADELPVSSEYGPRWVYTATGGTISSTQWTYDWNQVRGKWHPKYFFRWNDLDSRYSGDDFILKVPPEPSGDINVNGEMLQSNEKQFGSQTSALTRNRTDRLRCTLFLVAIGILVMAAVAIPLTFYLWSLGENSNEVVGRVGAKLKLVRIEFTEQLLNKSSSEYRVLSRIFQEEVTDLFNRSSFKRNYRSCRVNGFSQGSVNVHYDMFFDISKNKIPVSDQIRNVFYSVERDQNDTSLGVLGDLRFKIDSIELRAQHTEYKKEINDTKERNIIFGAKDTPNAEVNSTVVENTTNESDENTKVVLNSTPVDVMPNERATQENGEPITDNTTLFNAALTTQIVRNFKTVRAEEELSTNGTITALDLSWIVDTHENDTIMHSTTTNLFEITTDSNEVNSSIVKINTILPEISNKAYISNDTNYDVTIQTRKDVTREGAHKGNYRRNITQSKKDVTDNNATSDTLKFLHIVNVTDPVDFLQSSSVKINAGEHISTSKVIPEGSSFAYENFTATYDHDHTAKEETTNMESLQTLENNNIPKLFEIHTSSTVFLPGLTTPLTAHDTEMSNNDTVMFPEANLASASSDIHKTTFVQFIDSDRSDTQKENITSTFMYIDYTMSDFNVENVTTKTTTEKLAASQAENKVSYSPNVENGSVFSRTVTPQHFTYNTGKTLLNELTADETLTTTFEPFKDTVRTTSKSFTDISSNRLLPLTSAESTTLKAAVTTPKTKIIDTTLKDVISNGISTPPTYSEDTRAVYSITKNNATRPEFANNSFEESNSNSSYVIHNSSRSEPFIDSVITTFKSQTDVRNTSQETLTDKGNGSHLPSGVMKSIQQSTSSFTLTTGQNVTIRPTTIKSVSGVSSPIFGQSTEQENTWFQLFSWRNTLNSGYSDEVTTAMSETIKPESTKHFEHSKPTRNEKHENFSSIGITSNVRSSSIARGSVHESFARMSNDTIESFSESGETLTGHFTDPIDNNLTLIDGTTLTQPSNTRNVSFKSLIAPNVTALHQFTVTSSLLENKPFEYITMEDNTDFEKVTKGLNKVSDAYDVTNRADKLTSSVAPRNNIETPLPNLNMPIYKPAYTEDNLRLTKPFIFANTSTTGPNIDTDKTTSRHLKGENSTFDKTLADVSRTIYESFKYTSSTEQFTTLTYPQKIVDKVLNGFNKRNHNMSSTIEVNLHKHMTFNKTESFGKAMNIPESHNYENIATSIPSTDSERTSSFMLNYDNTSYGQITDGKNTVVTNKSRSVANTEKPFAENFVEETSANSNSFTGNKNASIKNFTDKEYKQHVLSQLLSEGSTTSSTLSTISSSMNETTTKTIPLTNTLATQHSQTNALYELPAFPGTLSISDDFRTSNMASDRNNLVNISNVHAKTGKKSESDMSTAETTNFFISTSTAENLNLRSSRRHRYENSNGQFLPYDDAKFFFDKTVSVNDLLKNYSAIPNTTYMDKSATPTENSLYQKDILQRNLLSTTKHSIEDFSWNWLSSHKNAFEKTSGVLPVSTIPPELNNRASQSAVNAFAKDKIPALLGANKSNVYSNYANNDTLFSSTYSPTFKPNRSSRLSSSLLSSTYPTMFESNISSRSNASLLSSLYSPTFEENSSSTMNVTLFSSTYSPTFEPNRSSRLYSALLLSTYPPMFKRGTPSKTNVSLYLTTYPSTFQQNSFSRTNASMFSSLYPTMNVTLYLSAYSPMLESPSTSKMSATLHSSTSLPNSEQTMSSGLHSSLLSSTYPPTFEPGTSSKLNASQYLSTHLPRLEPDGSSRMNATLFSSTYSPMFEPKISSETLPNTSTASENPKVLSIDRYLLNVKEARTNDSTVIKQDISFTENPITYKNMIEEESTVSTIENFTEEVSVTSKNVSTDESTMIFKNFSTEEPLKMPVEHFTEGRKTTFKPHTTNQSMVAFKERLTNSSIITQEIATRESRSTLQVDTKDEKVPTHKAPEKDSARILNEMFTGESASKLRDLSSKTSSFKYKRISTDERIITADEVTTEENTFKGKNVSEGSILQLKEERAKKHLEMISEESTINPFESVTISLIVSTKGNTVTSPDEFFKGTTISENRLKVGNTFIFKGASSVARANAPQGQPYAFQTSTFQTFDDMNDLSNVLNTGMQNSNFFSALPGISDTIKNYYHSSMTWYQKDLTNLPQKKYLYNNTTDTPSDVFNLKESQFNISKNIPNFKLNPKHDEKIDNASFSLSSLKATDKVTSDVTPVPNISSLTTTLSDTRKEESKLSSTTRGTIYVTPLPVVETGTTLKPQINSVQRTNFEILYIDPLPFFNYNTQGTLFIAPSSQRDRKIERNSESDRKYDRSPAKSVYTDMKTNLRNSSLEDNLKKGKTVFDLSADVHTSVNVNANMLNNVLIPDNPKMSKGDLDTDMDVNSDLRKNVSTSGLLKDFVVNFPGSSSTNIVKNVKKSEDSSTTVKFLDGKTSTTDSANKEDGMNFRNSSLIASYGTTTSFMFSDMNAENASLTTNFDTENSAWSFSTNSLDRSTSFETYSLTDSNKSDVTVNSSPDIENIVSTNTRSYFPATDTWTDTTAEILINGSFDDFYTSTNTIEDMFQADVTTESTYRSTTNKGNRSTNILKTETELDNLFKRYYTNIGMHTYLKDDSSVDGLKTNSVVDTTTSSFHSNTNWGEDLRNNTSTNAEPTIFDKRSNDVLPQISISVTSPHSHSSENHVALDMEFETVNDEIHTSDNRHVDRSYNQPLQQSISLETTEMPWFRTEVSTNTSLYRNSLSMPEIFYHTQPKMLKPISSNLTLKGSNKNNLTTIPPQNLRYMYSNVTTTAYTLLKPEVLPIDTYTPINNTQRDITFLKPDLFALRNTFDSPTDSTQIVSPLNDRWWFGTKNEKSSRPLHTDFRTNITANRDLTTQGFVTRSDRELNDFSTTNKFKQNQAKMIKTARDFTETKYQASSSVPFKMKSSRNTTFENLWKLGEIDWVHKNLVVSSSISSVTHTVNPSKTTTNHTSDTNHLLNFVDNTLSPVLDDTSFNQLAPDSFTTTSDYSPTLNGTLNDVGITQTVSKIMPTLRLPTTVFPPTTLVNSTLEMLVSGNTVYKKPYIHNDITLPDEISGLKNSTELLKQSKGSNSFKIIEAFNKTTISTIFGKANSSFDINNDVNETEINRKQTSSDYYMNLDVALISPLPLLDDAMTNVTVIKPVVISSTLQSDVTSASNMLSNNQQTVSNSSTNTNSIYKAWNFYNETKSREFLHDESDPSENSSFIVHLNMSKPSMKDEVGFTTDWNLNNFFNSSDEGFQNFLTTESYSSSESPNVLNGSVHDIGIIHNKPFSQTNIINASWDYWTSYKSEFQENVTSIVNEFEIINAANEETGYVEFTKSKNNSDAMPAENIIGYATYSDLTTGKLIVPSEKATNKIQALYNATPGVPNYNTTRLEEYLSTYFSVLHDYWNNSESGVYINASEKELGTWPYVDTEATNANTLNMTVKPLLYRTGKTAEYGNVSASTDTSGTTTFHYTWNFTTPISTFMQTNTNQVNNQEWNSVTPYLNESRYLYYNENMSENMNLFSNNTTGMEIQTATPTSYNTNNSLTYSRFENYTSDTVDTMFDGTTSADDYEGLRYVTNTSPVYGHERLNQTFEDVEQLFYNFEGANATAAVNNLLMGGFLSANGNRKINSTLQTLESEFFKHIDEIDIQFWQSADAVIGSPLSMVWNAENISGWIHIKLEREFTDGRSEVIAILQSETMTVSYGNSTLFVSTQTVFDEDSAKVILEFTTLTCEDEALYALRVYNSTRYTEHKVQLKVLRIPASVIVTPKEFFSNEPLHTIKCKADIGYPFGKVVLRISYDEGNYFENYFVSNEKMDVQASADCYKLVLVNFTDSSRTKIASVDFQASKRPSLKIKHTRFFHRRLQKNLTRVQCGVYDTDGIRTGEEYVMSKQKVIRIIPGDICDVKGAGLFPHPYEPCSFIECPYRIVKPCPVGTCFDFLKRRCTY